MPSGIREWFRSRRRGDGAHEAQSSDADDRTDVATEESKLSSGTRRRSPFDDYDDRDYERVWQDENASVR